MVKDFMGSRQELDSHPQPIEVVDDVSKRSAFSISRGTAYLMHLYIDGQLGDFKTAKDFLTRGTMDFLFKAEKGFHSSYHMIDRLALMSPEDRAEMEKRALAYAHKADPDDKEAFGFSLVILSAMPDHARYRKVPTGFSRHGALTPPATVIEFSDRLWELRDEVAGIIRGETRPGTPLDTRNSLLRMGMFFQVAATLPLRAA